MKPSNSKRLPVQIVTYRVSVSSFANVNTFYVPVVSVDIECVSFVKVRPKLSGFLRISRHDFD